MYYNNDYSEDNRYEWDADVLRQDVCDPDEVYEVADYTYDDNAVVVADYECIVDGTIVDVPF